MTEIAGSRRIRVLHVVPYYPPARIGGVGEVVRHVHEALQRAGHSSTVLTMGTDDADPHVIRAATSPAGFALNSWRHVGLTRTAEVIHMHHGEAISLLLAIKLMRIATPVVLTLHASPEHIREAQRPFTIAGRRLGGGRSGLWNRLVTLKLRAWLDRLALRLADEVSFISESGARDFLGDTAAADATVIYNGLPDVGAAPAVEETAPELLFVGTWSVRKRAEMLPFILAAIRRRRPHTRLRVIGFTAEDQPQFLELTRSLGLEHAIEIVGRRSSDELPPYYRAARVLLVPSAYEGLPMVILEALQNGLPCVATRVSGHPEVIRDGETGFLVDVDDPEAMADAALRVLDDEGLLADMADRGRSLVTELFSVRIQAARYLDLYNRVIQRSQARRR